MKLADLHTGERFRFIGGQAIFMARGNGWYSSVRGYDGGPWCIDPQTEVNVMRNARFWIWLHDGYIKLTLRPKQCLTWFQSYRTDEGWSSECETYTHTGDGVECLMEDDGVDCDGRLSHSGTCFCPLDQLKARDMEQLERERIEYRNANGGNDKPDPCYNGIFAPEWQKVRSSQRDYEAEKAGY